MADQSSAALRLAPKIARSEDEMLLDLHRSMRRSTYTLSAGTPSREYTDFDGYYLGGQGDHDFSGELAQLRLAELVGKIVPRIAAAAAKHSITRLAFSEKRDDGPIGMLTQMNLIMLTCGIESCIVRPEKRLYAASIKGRPILPGERVMVVSDVSTSGHTILRSAIRLRELGAYVPSAFVLLDRSAAARESLANDGIALESFWTIERREQLLSQLSAARPH